MSEYEKPDLRTAGSITVDDVRALAGAATPHFSLQIRNRLRRLVAPLDASDPARQLAELEIARLEKLAVEGERANGSDLTPLREQL
ncbi:MAG: hypothetical protein ACRDKI_11485 [Solirubrobacterales bacterium]